MVYSSKIPQGNQRGTDTQDPMLQNFTAIKTFIDTNHVTFGDPNQGKHSKIVMPVSTSAPTTIAAEVALFAMMSNMSFKSSKWWKFCLKSKPPWPKELSTPWWPYWSYADLFCESISTS